MNKELERIRDEKGNLYVDSWHEKRDSIDGGACFNDYCEGFNAALDPKVLIHVPDQNVLKGVSGMTEDKFEEARDKAANTKLPNPHKDMKPSGALMVVTHAWERDQAIWKSGANWARDKMRDEVERLSVLVERRDEHVSFWRDKVQKVASAKVRAKKKAEKLAEALEKSCHCGEINRLNKEHDFKVVKHCPACLALKEYRDG